VKGVQGLRRSPNGAIMVRMVARLCCVLSCLLVAFLGGCGGGSQAASPPGAPADASAAPATCVPGASIACACVTGQQGAQVCTAAGTFAGCVCLASDSGAAVALPDAQATQPDAQFVRSAACGTTECGKRIDLIAAAEIDCGPCPDAGTPDVPPAMPDSQPQKPDATSCPAVCPTYAKPVISWTLAGNGGYFHVNPPDGFYPAQWQNSSLTLSVTFSAECLQVTITETAGPPLLTMGSTTDKTSATSEDFQEVVQMCYLPASKYPQNRQCPPLDNAYLVPATFVAHAMYPPSCAGPCNLDSDPIDVSFRGPYVGILPTTENEHPDAGQFVGP